MPNYENLELKELNYNSYLKVPELLSLQHELSEPKHHDEMFFIIIHQAAELWFKLMRHETAALIEDLRAGRTPKKGSQTGRQGSCPCNGPTTLKEMATVQNG